jgi:hypothetical protein
MTKVHLLGAATNYDTGKQVVEKGQVVQMEGYGYDRYVVSDVINREGDLFYELINLRTKKFDQCDLIRPLSQKFGIGYYFDDKNPQFMDSSEVAILRNEAEQNKKVQQEALQKEAERNGQLKAAGRERLKAIIPANAKAIVVAERREDESDSMTDYFGYRTTRTVILGFSSHERDLFPELRKYAIHFPETAPLSEANEKYEHREKYTGGEGYYLGENRYSGWIVKKKKFYGKPEQHIECYALAAGDEANICIRDQEKASVAPETATGRFILVDYSEKALAVFGDTRAIKDRLKELGGRFNPKLTHGGIEQAGWVFSKNREAQLRIALTGSAIDK